MRSGKKRASDAASSGDVASSSRRKAVASSSDNAGAGSSKRKAVAEPRVQLSAAWANLKHYRASINLYKRWSCGPPGSGAPPKTEEFTSGLVETPEELAIVVEQLLTMTYVTIKGAPGSRVDIGHPLRTASEQGTIDFRRYVVAMAIFPDRVIKPTIVSVAPSLTPTGPELQVFCGSLGKNRSSQPQRNGQQYVGFAAVVVPRPSIGTTWRAQFTFGQKLPEQEGVVDDDDDD